MSKKIRKLRVYDTMHRPNILSLIRQGFNHTEIQRRLNWTKSQIDNFFSTYDGYYRPTKRQFYVNDEFFDVIDTETKAYWLGFLYADGCICHINLTMALQRGDEDHLKRLLKDLNAEYNIYRHDNTYIYKGETRCRYVSSIAISSLYLTQSLIKQGCFRRKTLNLQFPTQDQVPDHLIRHFIRGYFDGDGCISASKRHGDGQGSKSLDFVSCDDFIQSLSRKIETDIGIKPSHIQPHASTKGISYILYKSRDKITAMYSYLYKDASVFLERKKIKMEEVISSFRYEANYVEMPIIRREFLGQEITCRTLMNRFGCNVAKAGHICRRLLREGCAIYIGGGHPKRYKIIK